MKRQEWNGFTGGLWQDEIDVRNFIQKNYTPYGGDSSFLALAPATWTRRKTSSWACRPTSP